MKNLNHKSISKIYTKDIIDYIADLGWSDRIDTKWRNELIKDILEGFPDIIEDDLEKVLNIVLI